MRVEETRRELEALDSSIKKVLEKTGWDNWHEVEYSQEDPEEAFLATELTHILEKLESASNTLDYLKKPVTAPTTLHKGSNGRYQAESNGKDWEYTSGDGIEFLLPSPFDDTESWVASRMEYSQSKSDYYIVGYEWVQLDGLTVRKRGW